MKIKNVGKDNGEIRKITEGKEDMKEGTEEMVDNNIQEIGSEDVMQIYQENIYCKIKDLGGRIT